MKNKDKKNVRRERVIQNNYLVQYVNSVYRVDQVAGSDLMILNNNAIEIQIEKEMKK